MFYVKACFPTDFYNEATVTQLLGTEMPDDFSEPLGVDIERNIVLMNDLGSCLWSVHNQDMDAETRNKMLTAWGQIQLRSIPKKEQLVKDGLPVLDMKMYESILEDMFGDPEWWSHFKGSMSEEERSKYDWATCKDMFLTRIEDFYCKIEQYNVPFSLVHGDLNDGNVIVREDSGLTFIDLSHTVWSFPFLDFLLLDYDEVEEIECYLELWSSYESMDRLKELHDITVAFRNFYGHVRIYHMFKYAEQG